MEVESRKLEQCLAVAACGERGRNDEERFLDVAAARADGDGSPANDDDLFADLFGDDAPQASEDVKQKGLSNECVSLVSILTAVERPGAHWIQNLTRMTVTCVKKKQWWCENSSLPGYFHNFVELFIDGAEHSKSNAALPEKPEIPSHVREFAMYVENTCMQEAEILPYLEHFAKSLARLEEVFPGLLSENGKALVRMAGHDKQNGGAFNLKSVPAHCRLCVSESPLFKAYDEAHVKAQTEFLQGSQEKSSREKFQEISALLCHTGISDSLRKELLFGKVFHAHVHKETIEYLIAEQGRFTFLSHWSSPNHQFHSFLPWCTSEFKGVGIRIFMRDLKLLAGALSSAECIKCPVARALCADWPAFRDFPDRKDIAISLFQEIAIHKLGLSGESEKFSEGEIVQWRSTEGPQYLLKVP